MGVQVQKEEACHPRRRIILCTFSILMREKMSFQINITETHRSFALQHIGSNPAFMCGWAHGEEDLGKDNPTNLDDLRVAVHFVVIIAFELALYVRTVVVCVCVCVCLCLCVCVCLCMCLVRACVCARVSVF